MEGLAGGARPAFGGDERRHGPDRKEKQQARRAVEKLPGTGCNTDVFHRLAMLRSACWLLKAGFIIYGMRTSYI